MDIRATRRLNGQPSRARIACLHCRSRKVRCTITIKGPPCTNCQLDGLECVTRPKPRRRSKGSIHTLLAEEVVPSTPISISRRAIDTQRYDGWKKTETQDNEQRVCDLNGMDIFGRQTSASGIDEARIIEAALSVDSCMFVAIFTRSIAYMHILGPYLMLWIRLQFPCAQSRFLLLLLRLFTSPKPPAPAISGSIVSGISEVSPCPFRPHP